MLPTHHNPPGAKALAEEVAMHFRSIPFVHPRVIELSRGARAYAFALHAEYGSSGEAAAPECRPEVLAVDPEVGGFGVKRPLRFLAYKLELTEAQVSALAGILDELKIERAQAAVDDRRTLSAFADAVSAEAFDDTKAKEG